MNLPERLEPLACFPVGAWYRNVWANPVRMLRETTNEDPGPFSERHVQAVWADDRLRPSCLKTLDGQELLIHHAGQWNTGPGPDFLRAELELPASGRVLRGDVEIDLESGDWVQHGHHENPDFRNVVLHVLYRTPTTPTPSLSEDIPELALQPGLMAVEGFSFDQIDLSAYPYDVAPAAHSAGDRIQSWPVAWKHQLLRAAGEARLLQKSERLSRRLDRPDPESALFEEWMASLGYRRNQRPFRRLARLAIRLFRDPSEAARIEDCYAVLLGAAGLLPDNLESFTDPDTRQFVQSLWTAWWKMREEVALELSPEDWDMRGIRPLNHPRRRLVAAAWICSRGLDRVANWLPDPASDPLVQLQTLEADMDAIQHPFWDTRLAWTPGKPLDRQAIVGKERTRLFWNNVLVPLGTLRAPEDQRSAWMESLQPEPLNRLTRRTAHLLFGPDASRRLLKGGLARQGLLQLFEDMILTPPDADHLQCVLDRMETTFQSDAREEDGCPAPC